MLKRSDIYKTMLNRKKNISKKVTDKTFTNSSKSKILKYSLLIKNENVIRHRWTFMNLYSSSWELIVSIDFDVRTDLAEHNIRCIIFFRVLKKEMYFISTDKGENIRLHKIAITSSIIYDFSFVTVKVWKMSRKIAVRMKWIKIFRN